MINLLKNQPTEANPHIIESYPYGRLRCIMKVHLETSKTRGDRVVRQTQNPKTDVWNKPKKSTYSPVLLLGIDEETGFIETGLVLSPYGNHEEFKEKLERIKEVNLNEHQELTIKQLKYAHDINNAKNKAMDRADVGGMTTRKFKHKVTGQIVESVPVFNMSEYEEYEGTPEEIKAKADKRDLFLKYYDEELGKVGIRRNK